MLGNCGLANPDLTGLVQSTLRKIRRCRKNRNGACGLPSGKKVRRTLEKSSSIGLLPSKTVQETPGGWVSREVTKSQGKSFICIIQIRTRESIGPHSKQRAQGAGEINLNNI